jgi:hypothetical protein
MVARRYSGVNGVLGSGSFDEVFLRRIACAEWPTSLLPDETLADGAEDDDTHANAGLQAANDGYGSVTFDF